MNDAPHIFSALAGVMEECREVAKRDFNEQQRFSFRGIDAVVNVVGPILRTHKVMVIPEVEETAYVAVKTSTGKDQTSCRVVVRYTFYAEDGSSLSARVAAESSDSGDKATPKAMSVAFRIALLQALALPTDADPDSEPASRRTAKTADSGGTRRMARGNISPDQLKLMGALMTQLGLKERDAALSYVAGVIGREVESRNDLTKAEASTLIDNLQARANRAKEPDDAA